MRRTDTDLTVLALVVAAIGLAGTVRTCSAGPSALAALQRTSKAFAELAKKTAPAVVFVGFEIE